MSNLNECLKRTSTSQLVCFESIETFVVNQLKEAVAVKGCLAWLSNPSILMGEVNSPSPSSVILPFVFFLSNCYIYFFKRLIKKRKKEIIKKKE